MNEITHFVYKMYKNVTIFRLKDIFKQVDFVVL